jgi:hypothetical protein
VHFHRLASAVHSSTLRVFSIFSPPALLFCLEAQFVLEVSYLSFSIRFRLPIHTTHEARDGVLRDKFWISLSLLVMLHDISWLLCILAFSLTQSGLQPVSLLSAPLSLDFKPFTMAQVRLVILPSCFRIHSSVDWLISSP